jgi:hypothetical protein
MPNLNLMGVPGGGRTRNARNERNLASGKLGARGAWKTALRKVVLSMAQSSTGRAVKQTVSNRRFEMQKQ